MQDLEPWLERVYRASGNPCIAIATGFMGRHIDDYDARILDAGGGTGNMAQILHQMGYRNIDGLDPSADMLEIARGKKIYRELHQLYLQRQVDLPQASYDAIVAAGVLTHGHAPPEAIDGLLGLARDGAVMVF